MSTTARTAVIAATTIGDVTVTAIRDIDIHFPMPVTEVFPDVADEDWERTRTRYPESFSDEGGWRYVVTCYVVTAGSRRVLVDTGCGPGALAFPSFIGVGGALRAGLERAGIAPGDIDTVVVTHVHPDHVGGVLAPGDGPPAPAFANARYLVPRADVETWMRPEVQEAFPVPYVGDTLEPLMGLGVVDLVAGEHTVAPGLTLLHTPGHTPGSVSLLITSGDERAMLVGDAWLHPGQVGDPDMRCGFDMDPEAAAVTRVRLAERLRDEGMTMGACHFPEPFGQLVRLEGRTHWMPVTRWGSEGG